MSPASQKKDCCWLKYFFLSIWGFLLKNTFLGRFFSVQKPLATPPPSQSRREIVEGKISIYRRTTGYLGADQKYKFKETLFLGNETPLKVSPTDFYCETLVNMKGKEQVLYLPSSLFVQAPVESGGKKIDFVLGEKRYSLELASNFDAHFKGVQQQLKTLSYEFLYPEDVPENYHAWGENIYLSPETKRVCFPEKGINPLDFKTLKPLSTSNSDWNQPSYLYPPKQNIIYRIEAPGNPEVDILLDRNYLYVRVMRDFPSDKNVIFDNRRDFFLSVRLPVRSECIDASNISVTTEAGLLTLKIPFFN